MKGDKARAAYLAQASVLAFACLFAIPASAQTSSPVPATPAPVTPTPVKLQTLAPKGFEGLDDSVSTDFDVTFQQRSIGSFRATYKDGLLTFADPAAVAKALGPNVNTVAVTTFLSKPLNGNELYRCRPGQLLGTGCGELPSGVSGVIANPDRFNVSLFLSREYLISQVIGIRMLGPAMSGPSLIQTVQFAVSKNDSRSVNYGGTFDTLASLGQISVVGQTTLSDFEGLQSQQLYAQRIWSDRRAAAGLIQDYQSLIFSNYRILGGEFGSFYGTMLDSADDTATPLEILLPQRAQVEIYRDGILVAAGRYEAGLQLLNTRSLPDGSYSVRIVARDGGRVLLDETRAFSKMSNQVPPGKTGFRVRVGERVQDSFLDALSEDHQGFLPRTTGELVINASAQRRLGGAMAGSVSVTSFASKVYGEGSLQLFRGRLSGLVGGGVGSDGAYSGLISLNFDLRKVGFYISARKMHLPGDVAPLATDDSYFPFYRSQETIFASVQTRMLGGSLSLTGSYSRSAQFSDRYAAGVQYSRSANVPLAGSALVTFGLTKSDFDTRASISISFFKRVDRKTTLSGTVGGQYVTDSEPGVGGRQGFSPVGEAVLSRSMQAGPVDMVGEVGGGTDADGDRAFGRLRSLSPYGSADASVEWQDRGGGSDNLSYLMNGQTGIVIGGGDVKIGMRAPAESIVVVDLTDVKAAADQISPNPGPGTREEANGQPDFNTKVAAGGYRITVDGQSYDYIEPGRRVALGLPALKEYSIGLRPEGAPQFDVDVTRHAVRLYPGNVVRVRFEAQQVISLFGQILSAQGKPLARARIEAGDDFAVADDNGYFTITAPLSSALKIRTGDGQACLERVISTLVESRTPSLLYRFGKLRCSAGSDPISDSGTSDRTPNKTSSPPEKVSRLDPARREHALPKLAPAGNSDKKDQTTADANSAELARIRRLSQLLLGNVQTSDASETRVLSRLVAAAFIRNLPGAV